MSSGQGSSTGINGWLYVSNELASHVPSSFFVRLNNLEFTPMSRLISRRGLEPVRYYTYTPDTDAIEASTCLVKVQGTAEDNVDEFLPNIETATLSLFGDSLTFAGPNAESFYILPFSITDKGNSKLYEYLAKDINGNTVSGNQRGGLHIYNGKCMFWNGYGTYQVFARSIAEAGFTRLNNDVLPIEDQTIIGATTFENRLVVVSLQGYIMWSQPDWDGVSLWQDSEGSATNWIQLSTDPGEIIEFVEGFRGGLIVSTRTTANVSGRILNVPTLDQTALQVIDTGVDSFFTKNAVIASTDQLVGISPQGVINVSYDSLARTAKAEFSTSAPIIEYLSEIFDDNSVSSYLDAHLDTKNRKGYFVHDWSTDGSRESKILVYDYNSDRWSLFKSELPIQRVFQMYDTLCGAGWVRRGSDLFLGIWSFTDYNYDVSFTIDQGTADDGTTIYYRGTDTSNTYTKSFTTGVLNTAKVGPGEVPGTGQLPLQLLFSTEDPADYKLLLRQFSQDTWTGSLTEAKTIQMTDVSDVEKYSIGDSDDNKGRWDLSHKVHGCYQRFSATLPNPNLYYQLMFESDAPTTFQFHSLLRDGTRKS